MRKAGWATLFAYMHRRFGPPHMGGDDYKDLSAGWMLTTPDPDVFVWVSPSLSGPGFSFSPYVAGAADKSRRIHAASDLKLAPERVSAIRQAYKDTLVDLLRPVCVHDQNINALGELGESARDEALLAYDEATDEPIYVVRFHPSSGYAMPLGLFGGEAWPTMCELIRQLGSGDMAAGRTALISLLQEPAIQEAAKAPHAVHRLMLLGAWKDRKALGRRLGLSDADIERFDTELTRINGKEGRDTSIVDEMTDGALQAAQGFLVRLGKGGGDLTDSVRRYRVDKAVEDAWEDLQGVARDDFPAEALPKNTVERGGSLPESLKAGFVAHGRQDLVAWLERTLSRPGGAEALAQIAWHLVNSRRAQPHEAVAQ